MMAASFWMRAWSTTLPRIRARRGGDRGSGDSRGPRLAASPRARIAVSKRARSV